DALTPTGTVATAVNPGMVGTDRFPHRDMAERGSRLVMQPERIAEAIVEVVRKGKGPEVSIPRWLASFQAVRVLAPPLYRFGLTRVVTRAMLAARVDEGCPGLEASPFARGIPNRSSISRSCSGSARGRT